MIFQVKKKSDFVAARLAKSAEAWKKKEQIEALQEEIKREKDGGGGEGDAARPCGRKHTGVCVCVCQRKIYTKDCVCVRARTSACITKKRKFQKKLQPQQAIQVILQGISSKHNLKEKST